ncbi:MAG TPA: carbohydrate ABC transporter permease [Caproiciproducens sp.]|nr:carbohydrate ABC transporter permease [Caproiciproducens sp.]
MTAKKISISDLVFRIILFLWGIGILFPLGWVFYQSLKTNNEFFMNVWKFPAKPQWNNYATAWNELNIGTSYLNTFIYVGVSMLLGLFITTISAYAFSRLNWRGKKALWKTIMLSAFLPGTSTMAPLYVIMRNLHLLNSISGLIIVSSFGENVFLMMLLSGFMKSIPKEIEESAYIDGASFFKIYRKIILPLSTPGIVTCGLFMFMGLYNNFIFPLICLSDPEKYTITVNMYEAYQAMQFHADWTALCAGTVIAMIIPIIVYIFFQKQIVEGATLGAIKS